MNNPSANQGRNKASNHNEKMRKAGLDMVLTFSRQFLGGLMQLFIVFLVAKALGAEAMGIYSISLLLPTLLSQFLNFGLPSANIYFVASSKYAIGDVWSVNVRFWAVMAVLGLGLGYLIVELAGGRIFPGVSSTMMFIALVLYPFSLLTSLVASLFQAVENFRFFNVVVIGQPVVALLSVLGLFLLDALDLNRVLIVIVFSHFFSAAIALLLFSRVCSLFKVGDGESGYLKEATSYSLKSHLANLVSFLNYRLDLLLVNYFTGPAIAGVYNVAVRLVEQLWMVSQAVSTVLVPRLSAMFSDEEGRRLLCMTLGRVVFWVTAVGGIVLYFAADFLISVLFDKSFSDASEIVAFLLPGVVLFSVSRVLGNDLAARGNVGINLALAVLILVFNVAANIVLIPHYGALGAAFSTSLAYVLTLLMRLVIQKSLSGVIWWKLFIPQRGDLALIGSLFNKIRSRFRFS